MKHLTTIAERNARLRANGFNLAKALERRGPFVRKLMREGMAARQAQGQTPAPTA